MTLRLCHTIVPWRCCGDCADRTDGWLSSDCGTCNGDPPCIWESTELNPNDEPPKLDGFMPPLLLTHGTPSTGNGSSGGVTYTFAMATTQMIYCESRITSENTKRRKNKQKQMKINRNFICLTLVKLLSGNFQSSNYISVLNCVGGVWILQLLPVFFLCY